MSPLVPLFILAAGAVGLSLGLHPRFRFVGLYASIVAGLSLLTALAQGLWLPASGVFSRWEPAEMFPASLNLQVDALSWPLAVALLVTTTAILVTGLSRPGGRRLSVRGGILLIGFSGLGSILAGNLLTLSIMWAVLDLIYFVALLSQVPRSQESIGKVVVSLAVNSAGTLSVIAASVLMKQSGEPASFESPLSAPVIMLIAVAALFRLGLLPPRLGLPDEVLSRKGLGIALRLGPAAAAIAVLARSAGMGFPEPTRVWLTLAGLGAVFFGGVQLWVAEEPRAETAPFVWSLSGLALLAGVWGAQVQAWG